MQIQIKEKYNVSYSYNGMSLIKCLNSLREQFAGKLYLKPSIFI